MMLAPTYRMVKLLVADACGGDLLTFSALQ